jgi:hypothetical protein
MAHPNHENNDSYRLHRTKPDGLVSVFNQDGFLIAEYNPISGATAWLRVVPVPKRQSLERKLSEQFPMVAETRAPAYRSRSKQKRGKLDSVKVR